MNEYVLVLFIISITIIIDITMIYGLVYILLTKGYKFDMDNQKEKIK